MLTGKTTAQWLAIFEREGVPSAPVLNRHEAIEHPQVIANNILIEYQHPVAGRLRQTRTAARFSGTPPDLSRGAPRLGEHNTEILTELGFSEREIDKLRERGVIGAETYPEFVGK